MTNERRVSYGSKEWHEREKQRRAEGRTPAKNIGFEGFLLGTFLGIFGVAGAFLFSSKAEEKGERTIGAIIGTVVWFVLLQMLI